VGSLFEVYTTMLGWSFYNTFYELLSMTGILYFPFLMALYNNWKMPYESQEGRAASITSQRRMQVAVVTLLLVFSFAVLPVFILNPGEITYHKACSEGGSTVVTRHIPGNETTSYSDNIGDLSEIGVVRVPAYWWFLLSFSSGVNNAATAGISCIEDIKGLDQQLRNLTINDPSLREEYTRFANECYLPAKSKMYKAINGDYGDNFRNYVNSQLALYSPNGEPDPLFIGSDFLLQSAGFYRTVSTANCATTTASCSLRARNPVPNWPYDSDRDVNHSQQNIEDDLPGTPFCDDWWVSQTIGQDGQPLGLRHKLLSSVERSSTDVLSWDDDASAVRNVTRFFENGWANLTYSEEEIERLVISRYTQAEPPPMVDDQFFRSAELRRDSLAAGGLAAGIAVTAAGSVALPVIKAGVALAAIDIANTLKDFYLTTYILKSAAPFAQGVLLMMMYALMIFYFVVSEYDLKSILLMTFLILAVRFFTPLWDIADYLDAQLFSAMYPDPVNEIASTLTQGINRLILDMVMTVNYFVVPAILMLIMGMAGAKLGDAVGSMGAMTKPLERVGRGVGNVRTKK
jgi:hypothetical protein